MDARAIYRLLLVSVIVAGLTVLSGCKKDEDPTGPAGGDIVPADIFPLTPGHTIMYNGYLTRVDANGVDTEVEIPGTSTGFYVSWTVTNVTHPTFGMTVLVDTMIAPAVTGGIATPIVDNLLGDYTTSTGNYGFVTDIGFFFRTFGITSADSLVKITLAKTGIAVGSEFTMFEQTYNGLVGGAAAPVTLSIKGKWESKSTVTLNGTAYEAYYLIASRTIAVAGNQVAGGITAKAWFTSGLGPVKVFFAGDAEAPGRVQVITGKNF